MPRVSVISSSPRGTSRRTASANRFQRSGSFLVVAATYTTNWRNSSRSPACRIISASSGTNRRKTSQLSRPPPSSPVARYGRATPPAAPASGRAADARSAAPPASRALREQTILRTRTPVSSRSGPDTTPAARSGAGAPLRGTACDPPPDLGTSPAMTLPPVRLCPGSGRGRRRAPAACRRPRGAAARAGRSRGAGRLCVRRRRRWPAPRCGAPPGPASPPAGP